MKRLVPVCLTVVLFGCSTPPQDETAQKPTVMVKAAKAETADVQLTIQAPATIFPREQANISARTTAPILRLRARKGDTVTAGQVLAELEHKDLEAQQAEASANVADAEAALQKAAAGTLPADLERARGQLQSVEAALNQAQKNYDRRRDLFSQGAIPNRDLLASETELAQAKTAVEVARRTLQLLEQQTGKTDIRMAETRVQQAKARQSLVAAQLQFTELRSSLNGTITEQYLYPGDMAKPDAPVFTVMDLSVAIAHAQVSEAEAGRISRGQACSFSQADQPNNSSRGTITVINQAVDPARRTVEVWCELSNRQGNLKAGMFGSVTVSVGRAEHAVVLPESAVQFQEGSARGTALVVDQQRMAHVREVEAMAIPGGKVRIVRGIEAGETVVIEGGYGLPDGTQVTFAGATAETGK
jgi:HlyD family secretion protein